MPSLLQIVRFLNKELNIRKIPDKSKNGLQVKGKKQVKKVGFAVDACLSTFEKAKKVGCDLLIVHHGIKWKKNKYKELTEKREKFLKKNKIALYGAHLPLDLHNKYGNNIQLCKLLELTKIKRFGRYHGFKIGYKGQFTKSTNINKITNILNKKLKTKCTVLSFGKKSIKSIGTISGSGSEAIEDVVKEKIDCFIVGEIPLNAYHRAKDYKINMIVAGHYATETLGVKALMPLIKEKFNIPTVFIDNPTGL